MIRVIDFELFIDEVKITDLERRDHSYTVFIYKYGEDYEVFADHDPYAPDTPEKEFIGNVVISPDPELLLQKRQKDLMIYLYSVVDDLYGAITSGFSVLEKESWKLQEEEARKLLAVHTPTIDALCAVRNCSRDYLAKKIVENADNAQRTGLSILAKQQETESIIKSMSLDDFNTIWEAITKFKE